MFSRILAAAAATTLLGACDTIQPHTGSPDPGFGEAVKYNAAVQTIDPDPVYAEGGSQPGDSGAKGAEAVKRYRTNAVKEVESESTTATSSGGSGPR